MKFFHERLIYRVRETVVDSLFDICRRVPVRDAEGLRLTDQRLKIRIALYDLHTPAAFTRWNLKRRGAVRRGVCRHHDGLAAGPQGPDHFRTGVQDGNQIFGR